MKRTARLRAVLLAACMAAGLAAPARADQYDDMRARFAVYVPICGGDAECVRARLYAWFGRNYEVHTVGGKTGIYLVWRDANRTVREYVLVGELP